MIGVWIQHWWPPRSPSGRALSRCSPQLLRPAQRSAQSARGAAEVQLDRITHQLAALDQAWYWTPEWQAGEAEADADLVAGRFVRFRTAEEMDAHLVGIPLPEQAASGSSRHTG